MQLNVHEAKSQLSQLLVAVESGEEVVIARNGVPVAMLVPAKQRGGLKLGLFDGQGVRTPTAAALKKLDREIESAFYADDSSDPLRSAPPFTLQEPRAPYNAKASPKPTARKKR